MNRFNLLLGSLCVVSVWTAPAFAAKVKVWNRSAAADYEKAQLRQAVISNEGALRLSRQLKPLAALDATHVWDVVEDPRGNLFVATGNEGKIFKLAPDGKLSVAFDAEDSQVLCLALGADGSVYAGTGPSGLVIRIGPDGNARVLFDSPESYVWSLATAASGEAIYAGTGPRGRVYKISADGKADVFYTTRQEHVLSVATGPRGLVYAGTDRGGLVYRIDSRGKGFVVYSAPQSEVRRLLVTDEGVYAGTSTPTKRGAAGGTVKWERAEPGGTSVAAVPASLTREATATAAAATTEKSKDSGEKTREPAAAPKAPASGENSLYRIDTDGNVREIFREKAMLLSLLRQPGRLFVGTGMDGQLFEIVEASREKSEIARLDHGQIHCLYRRRDGSIVAGTGDPGKLYVLHDRHVERGTVVSEVLDARLPSKWGALRWKADTPPGASVSVAVRSGNVEEPDDTWSDWSAEETDAQEASATAPAARFLQYRITLASTNPAVTPVLRSLSLRYATANQPPEITEIETPDLDAVNLDKKKLKLKWKATDPNEDDLTYSLYVRKEGWSDWVQLEENLEKKEYEWDTTTTPAGMYRVKVVASDRDDNPAEAALTAERVSAAFAVAHDPPAVSLKLVRLDGDQAVLEASATDPLVRLTSAAYSLDGRKWTPVFPADGLFDGKQETFRFRTDALKPGTHVLVLKVSDAAGNTGSADVAFASGAR